MEYVNVNDLFTNKTILKEIPNDSGIYLFHNIVNNKYYVGQAIRIRKRLSSHISNYTNSKYDNPLYRAFNKYGLDKFEYKILEIIPGSDFKEIRKKLDELEIKYIKEYNSFGKFGYNQTLGADGGILGYKFTKEQCEKQNRLKVLNTTESCVVYIYDTITNNTTKYLSMAQASKELRWNNNSRNVTKYLITHGHYIAARSLNDLTTKINLYKSKKTKRTYNKGTYKYSLEEYTQIKKDNPEFTFLDLAEFMGVSKDTIYNYEHKLNPSFIIKKVFIFKCIDTYNNTYKILNRYLGNKLFGVKDISNPVAYQKDHPNSLYKKRYKLIKLNINDLTTRIFGTEDYKLDTNEIIKHHFRLPDGCTITSIYDNLNYLNINDYEQID